MHIGHTLCHPILLSGATKMFDRKWNITLLRTSYYMDGLPPESANKFEIRKSVGTRYRIVPRAGQPIVLELPTIWADGHLSVISVAKIPHCVHKLSISPA